MPHFFQLHFLSLRPYHLFQRSSECSLKTALLSRRKIQPTIDPPSFLLCQQISSLLCLSLLSLGLQYNKSCTITLALSLSTRPHLARARSAPRWSKRSLQTCASIRSLLISHTPPPRSSPPDSPTSATVARDLTLETDVPQTSPSSRAPSPSTRTTPPSLSQTS